MHITKTLKTGTENAVTEAIITLNVPKPIARTMARKLISMASNAGQSIDDQLIPWIRSRPKFDSEHGEEAHDG